MKFLEPQSGVEYVLQGECVGSHIFSGFVHSDVFFCTTFFVLIFGFIENCCGILITPEPRLTNKRLKIIYSGVSPKETENKTLPCRNI